jgi:hypothetical protein
VATPHYFYPEKGEDLYQKSLENMIVQRSHDSADKCSSMEQ